MKKSQMELMGIAIVVVLVTMIMLFVVANMANKKPSEIRKSYGSSEMAANMIDTLMNTEAPDCHEMSFKELFRDCADGPQTFDCTMKDEYGTEYEDDSCKFINESTALILSRVFDPLKEKYRFNFSTSSSTIFVINDPSNGCDTSNTMRSQNQPLPSSTEALIVMSICY